jgi:hypothetical protein
VAAAAEPSVIDILRACWNQVGYRELEWHCLAPLPIIRPRASPGAGRSIDLHQRLYFSCQSAAPSSIQY